jgi:hypothetical protein
MGTAHVSYSRDVTAATGRAIASNAPIESGSG